MSQTENTIVHDKTFEVIKSAVNKLVDFVRPTLGPSGNKVIIQKNLYRMVVDDGVQIARDFEFNDPAENAVMNVIRETAVKTNDRVGDGTTGSLIMLQSIINEVARKSRRDGRRIAEELKRGATEAKSQLLKIAKKIKTKEELKKVSLIAFDSEPIAELISDIYTKIGHDGVVTIDKSQTMETTAEMTEGVKIERGYVSPYMVTNPDRMEAIVEKPYILFTDYRLTEHNDILPILNKMAEASKRELVIFCENIEHHALATVVLNKLQGKFLTVAVNLPSVDDRKVFLEDLANMTGGKVFTESKGDKLQDATIGDLGRADRFICGQEESVIVGPRGNKAEIATAIKNLRSAVDKETNEKKKHNLLYRLGRYTNRIAVIRVGAPTDNEQKALKYKVEDAVNAVRVAYKGGVVPGGGWALLGIKTSSLILNEALKRPNLQLLENIGDYGFPGPFKSNEAYNVVTGKWGDFLEIGVMDPVDVLIAAIESAVSIASILVTCSGIIVEHEKQNDHVV